MQKITQLSSHLHKTVIVESVINQDWKAITQTKYFFDWNTEKNKLVYKLRLSNSDEILGLMSLERFDSDYRIQINLLAVSKENRGKLKKYDGIAENLIAYACREAIKLYAENACVSLIPKTELKQHYIKKYAMLNAGRQVFLEGVALFKLLEKNEL